MSLICECAYAVYCHRFVCIGLELILPSCQLPIDLLAFVECAIWTKIIPMKKFKR